MATSALAKAVQDGCSEIASLLFPRACVHCGGAVEKGTFRHLCSGCEARLHFATGACCPTCGHPFIGAMEVGRICPHCELLVPEFGQGRTAVLLRGAGRSVIHTLKYHHGLHILEDIVAILRASPDCSEYAAGACLVPVPLHPRKQRERGYNQSDRLARCVQAASSGTRVTPLLRRVLDTVSQTTFDRAARQSNLKNAFALAADAVINPGVRYLIVDDVFTTGSTLNACAAVLRRAGALRVDVLTLGHG